MKIIQNNTFPMKNFLQNTLWTTRIFVLCLVIYILYITAAIVFDFSYSKTTSTIILFPLYNIGSILLCVYLAYCFEYANKYFRGPRFWWLGLIIFWGLFAAEHQAKSSYTEPKNVESELSVVKSCTISPDEIQDLGHQCSGNCSGHIAGYKWACEKYQDGELRGCGGKSLSFTNGCLIFAHQSKIQFNNNPDPYHKCTTHMGFDDYLDPVKNAEYQKCVDLISQVYIIQ